MVQIVETGLYKQVKNIQAVLNCSYYGFVSETAYQAYKRNIDLQAV